VLHQPTGILFLACSSPERRARWTPAANQLNSTSLQHDYVATYDPSTSFVTRLTVSDYPTASRGLALHGMDVIPSVNNPFELYVYLVNHRPPLDAPAHRVGADSVIEVFKTTLGSATMTHVRTFDDPAVVVTPNDVVGSSDGKGVFFTNDRVARVGLVRSQLIYRILLDT
jgi:hypothetical protein